MLDITLPSTAYVVAGQN